MYLYGASGHAKVIIDILQSQKVEIEGLFDDNLLLETLNGHPVLHEIKKKIELIVSIGDNKIRKKVVEKLSEINFGIAVHSSAIISKSASINAGTVVMQGAIIQSNSTIGRHCIINTAASIDHDCRISDYVHVSPNATLCGNVTIGEGSWIGAGTVIIPGVKIGKWSIIGAGSVVTKDIPDNILAVGNRCKIIKSIQ